MYLGSLVWPSVALLPTIWLFLRSQLRRPVKVAQAPVSIPAVAGWWPTSTPNIGAAGGIGTFTSGGGLTGHVTFAAGGASGGGMLSSLSSGNNFPVSFAAVSGFTGVAGMPVSYPNTFAGLGGWSGTVNGQDITISGTGETGPKKKEEPFKWGGEDPGKPGDGSRWDDI